VPSPLAGDRDAAGAGDVVVSAPRITGARLVRERYGAGVYRFTGSDRGLSVARCHHWDDDDDVERWNAVAITFHGDACDAFAMDRADDRSIALHEDIDAAELADLALAIRRER